MIVRTHERHVIDSCNEGELQSLRCARLLLRRPPEPRQSLPPEGEVEWRDRRHGQHVRTAAWRAVRVRR